MASGSNSQVVIDLDLEDENDKKPINLTIPQLISSLQSTFQAKYLAEVESVLVLREEKSKLEINSLKKQNDDLLKQLYEVERLQKLAIESEVKKHKTEICVLKEENSRLSEDRKVFSEREKGAEERIKSLVEEVKRIGEKDKEAILELRIKNCELESEKRRAETEIDIWKRRFRELETRVLRVEEDVELLMKVEPEKSNEKFVNVKNEVNVADDREGAPVAVKENGNGQSIGPNCGSPVEGNGDLKSTGSGRPYQNFVEISDSDDEFASGSILIKKDMTSKRPADSADSGQTGMVDGSKMLKRKLDPCLNTSGNEKGDNDDDNSRSGKCKIKKLHGGTSLAEFLLNGDAQGKLRKSVKELLEYDQKGLDDCKRLAIEHSRQLFEIYQKKEDPLFYP